MHTSVNGQGDLGFDFWSSNQTQYEEQFNVQFDEDSVDYSPASWETDMSKNVRNEPSPLLPRKHRCGNISPRSRLQVMAESRKKLMEMIHSMPESSYELSLKDIVEDEQQDSEEVQEEKPIKRTEAENIKQQKTKKTKSFSKSGNISRSGSMEKESFLIKMFIPTSLSFKIRDNTRNGSKVTARSSMDGTDKHTDKERWIKRVFFTEEGRNSGRSSSSSSSNCSVNRYGDTDDLPGCWPFFNNEKRKRSRNKEHTC